MAQNTQFLMTKNGASIHVQPSALATYLAAGWSIAGLIYSEGGEGLDTTSQVLMQKGPETIYIRPGSVATYVAAGWEVIGIRYGASQTEFSSNNGTLEFLDSPALSSAEIGTVAATKVVVTFSTEVEASDYAAGVTIEVDEVSKTISAAERQTDHKVVHYTIPAVAFGSTVTWSYDDATGGILSEVDGSHLDDVVDGAVTNNVEEA